ncbi:MAG: signal peptidase II [Ruminococcaceae bacterium]|nr:signal peptidase II [Oscillospiraceae bacterium]
MLYCLLIAFMALIVLVDQLVKAVVSANIPLGEVIPAIPGIFHWTHFHNTGAAFSMLQGGRWLFAAVCLVGLAVTVALVWKKVLTNRVELWCLAAIFGGGIGNLIDRLRLGYVVDMIEVEFMNFAVFNIADAFISCGAVALVVYVLFFDREKKPKEETVHDPEA